MKAKAYRAIILLGLLLVLGASASAQSGGTIEAAVPFDFHAGKAQLPAGTYAVTQFSQDTMRLISADGRNSVLIRAPFAPNARRGADSARLVFRRYGDQHFLTQVWLRADYGLGMSRSDGERNLVKELRRVKRVAPQPQKVEVAAQAKT